jgi:hypothetical protein
MRRIDYSRRAERKREMKKGREREREREAEGLRRLWIRAGSWL